MTTPPARRQPHVRVRRRVMAIGTLVLVVAVGAYVATRHTDSHPPRTRVARPGRTSAVDPQPRPEPQHPYGLTVAHDGTLYIVDVGRDQILKRARSGGFAVVAGNGRQGRTGDGGPATNAELRLQPQSGIVEGRDGALYFADSGNARVRAVLHDGTIATVAGNGRTGMLLHRSPALDAAIGPVAGLALGPTGDLYIAASNILRLEPGGVLEWVAGRHVSQPACSSVFCNPPNELDFTSPAQLAFDGAGNLFVSSSSGFGLYEIAANGARRYLGQFRGDGGAGALASAPGGKVIEAWRGGVTALVAEEPPARSPALRVVASRDLGYGARLDAALGEATTTGIGADSTTNKANVFIGGDGLAVAPSGDIYVDTNEGNAFTTVSALVRVSRSGHVTTLWKS